METDIKFVECKKCIYNLSDEANKVVCSVMVMEEPVIFEETAFRYGCTSGWDEDYFDKDY